jgi:hypothetical protein
MVEIFAAKSRMRQQNDEKNLYPFMFQRLAGAYF